MQTKLATRLLIQSRFFIAAIATLLALGTVSAWAEGGPKIATVDMQTLFKDYHRTTDAQKKINVGRARIRQDAERRQVEIDKLKEEMKGMSEQMEDPGIGDKKKRTIYQNLQAKRQEGMTLEQERRTFLERRNAALNEKMVARMKGILEEIRKKVEARAKADGYNLVVDKGGLSTSQVPLVLFSDIEDLTEGVLTDINKDVASGSE